jgi:hypothetical protein
MLLAFVCTVWAKVAKSWEARVWTSVVVMVADGHSALTGGEITLAESNGSIHRSVAGSLAPRKITFPRYLTIHSVVVKVTSQPTSVRTRMPKRDAIDKSEMMWPVSIVRRPSIAMSHM